MNVTMLEQIKQAIKVKDYYTGSQLLEQLRSIEPDNPWVVLYQAVIDEEIGNKNKAESGYRLLLQTCDNYKIISPARQGLERIEAEKKLLSPEPELQLFVRKNTLEPGNIGVLVLEPIEAEKKKTAAPVLAKIMQLDKYTANTQLPTRSWRLYRTGDMEELQFYTSSLKNASIPCFCTPIKDINEINVYNVNYFDVSKFDVTIVCQDQSDSQGELNFKWSDVKGRVEGTIPIFEEIHEKGLKGKIQTKTKVLDFAQFYDLHLPKKKTILRLCAQKYQFNEGINFYSQGKSFKDKALEQTLKENWQNLAAFLDDNLGQVPLWSDFTKFAETALDFRLMLQHIKPHINLLRIEPTPWDGAFQLYSGLVFLNYSS